MTAYLCTLDLTGRRPARVDGLSHPDGEILRFRLDAWSTLSRRETRQMHVELWLSRELLDSPGWTRLHAREIALHGQAFLREQIESAGLPEHSPWMLSLTRETAHGAFAGGPPYSLTAFDATERFSVSGGASVFDSSVEGADFSGSLFAGDDPSLGREAGP